MTPKDFLTNKAFCVLPWVGVFIQPNGEVKNCAISQDSIGNINQDNLDNILRSDKNVCIKKDMLSKVIDQRCSTCHNLESSQKNHFNQVSNRVWYIKIIKKDNLDFFSSPENFNLRILDLRWNNTCNFACVYCGPDLSSKWATELNEPQTIYKDRLQQSLNYIDSKLDQIEHVYLAGGEPLLIKENVSLLEKLHVINPNVDIRINTNLSIINNTTYNLLKKFTNVHWTVSVDNIAEEFEYVRYGGKWDIFVGNLKQLMKDFSTINFNLVWFILNYKSIFDCVDFLIDLGFHENTFIIMPLEIPNYLSVLNLPEDKIFELKDIIRTKLQKYNPSFALHNSLSLMLNTLEKSYSKNMHQLGSFLDQIDQRRQLNSQKLFPDLYSML